jgi:guanylate kinase
MQTKQTFHLQHLDEFEELLKNYSPSAENIAILKALPLVLLVGPTAAGRNTLINLLVKTGRYHGIVSDTTRPKRVNNGIIEKNGVEYWFKTEEEVLDGIKNGEYIEAAVIHEQQVSGQNILQLEAAHKEGKIAINEVEIDGAANIQDYKPDTLFIFLLPPTLNIWMQRIRDRGDFSDIELKRRLKSAQVEIKTGLNCDFYQFVINHEIHEAAQAVDELANGRDIDAIKQQLGREHAEQLLIDIKQFLDKA